MAPPVQFPPPIIAMIRGTDAMDQVVERDRRLTRGPRLYVLVAIAGAALAAALLLGSTVRRWAAAEDSVDLETLRVATVGRGDLARDVAVQGRIVAASHPRLYSPAGGIVQLAVRAGEGVRAGQLLARVASPPLEAELAQERSALESLRSALARQRIASRQEETTNDQNAALRRVRLEAARREMERAERLRAEGLLNQVDYDRGRDAVRLAEVELEQAEETARMRREALAFEREDASRLVERQRLTVAELERRVGELELRSPFDGLVATLEVEDRDAVVANRALLSVVDLSRFEVEISIPEAYADDVLPGTAAVVHYDGRELPGRVTAVSPEVTASQVEGRVAFVGDPPRGLRQSQRLSTRLLLEERRDVLKVQRGPFLESGGGRQVYVLADGLARLTPITVGAVSVSEVEIVDGLKEGDRILLTDIQQFNGAKTVLVRD
jgi:HlyD family secretion protein